MPQAPVLPWGIGTGDQRIQLERAISSLRKQAEVFISAVGLFHLARHESDKDLSARMPSELAATVSAMDNYWFRWKMIAARSAVFAAHDFGRAAADLRTAISSIPDLREKLDVAALKAAGKVFKNAFPDIGLARDAVAHPELFNKPGNAMASGTSVPGFVTLGGNAKISLRDGIYEDQYFTTFKGEMISCPLTEEAVAAILEATRSNFRCFASLSK